MPLVNQPFSDTFEFTRLCEATHRDPGGDVVTASTDEPRFDHDSVGAALGLLVEGAPEVEAPDRLRVRTGDWNAPLGTVLHEYAAPDGTVERRAWYAPNDARSAVDGCLNIRGHHRLIAYVPVYLRNRGGAVRWRNLLWSLGGVLTFADGVALGSTSDIPILEG